MAIGQVLIKWYIDDESDMHAVYVNDKQLAYGNVWDFHPTDFVDGICKFCVVANIDYKIIKYTWQFETDQNRLRAKPIE